MRGVLWALASTFLSLSLVAIGGANAALPEIHRQVVDTLHWMDDATFANLFALSQAAPGPNVLIVSLVGWHVAGLAGLLVATAAIILPAALVAFAAGRVVRRWEDKSWVRVLRDALIPVALGLILASGVVTARAADHGWLAYALSAAAAAYVILTRRNPLWALAAATLVSMAAALV